MTLTGIEPRSSGPLANTLPTRPIKFQNYFTYREDLGAIAIKRHSIPQISSARASSSDGLMSYPGHSFGEGEVYLSAEDTDDIF